MIRKLAKSAHLVVRGPADALFEHDAALLGERRDLAQIPHAQLGSRRRTSAANSALLGAVALEFIDTDELIELTPDAIRVRKRVLDTSKRPKRNRTRGPACAQVG